MPASFGGCPGPIFGLGCPIEVRSDPDAESEVAWSYELGYRIQPTKAVSLDFTAFVMDYENLILYGGVLNPASPFSIPQTNAGSQWSWGFEAFGQWKVNRWLRLAGSYTGFNLRDRRNPLLVANDELDPSHQFQLHSYLNLPWNLELDLASYFHSRYETGSTPEEKVSSDLRFDARLGWTPRPGVEISLVGQNLFDKRDVEVPTSPFVAIERAYYVKVDLGF